MQRIEIFEDITSDTLKMVNECLLKANGKDIEILIHSDGGSVYSALSSFANIRNYAKKYSASITSVVLGSCNSAATVFLLAGDRDKRIINEYTQPFVHNAIISQMSGDYKDFKVASDELKMATDKLADFYSKHANISYEEALRLMDEDTSLTVEQCKKYGFASIVREASPIMAKKIKNNNMSKKQSLLSMFLARKKERVENKLMYTIEREEVYFPNISDDEDPKVGDYAEVNGMPADGEYEMSNSKKYIFDKGTLTEIVEIEEVTETEIDEFIEDVASELVNKVEEVLVLITNLKELPNVIVENDNLKKEIKALKTKISNAKSEEAPTEKAKRHNFENKKSEISKSINNWKKNNKV